ncbi:citrate:H+ symporter [Nocardiopsis sp. HNM0947]|uniref:Citrate:H+ symporter n=1 Tax=Nocardiopsis coralli TaxID=2772213 RepID=A0ABR9PER2_9ACTN|nr:SLC13 family permease [Nocardiopsis coralli]MBE3002313.1 citrate:H+ symporter [Nocardiopsis coralli]
MLSIIGFAVIASVATLLILGRVSPIVGLTLIPLLGAFAAGFSPAEITEFFESGLGSVLDVAVMLIFAILFFGVLNDVHLFNPLINFMLRVSRGNIVGICVGTVLLAAVCHLDGSGATTFLICIPALLPLYKRLEMSPYLLMLLISTSIGIMNMLPWGGPVGRAAAVIGLSPIELWHGLIPVQAIGLVLLVGMAAILGLRERRRIAARRNTPHMSGVGGRGVDGTEQPPTPSGSGDATDGPADGPAGSAGSTDSSNTPGPDLDASPRRPLANYLLLAVTVGVLLTDMLPAGLVFMVALSLALLINTSSVAEQMERVRKHAPNALGTGGIILAAGAFLGILEESGMLDSLAGNMIAFLPEILVEQLHLVIGFLGMPLELVLSTDAYYFALLPLVDNIAVQQGVESTTVAYSLIIGNIIGTYISPFNASVWLAVGMAGVDLGKHIRYSFFWMWGFTLALFAASVAIGVIAI